MGDARVQITGGDFDERTRAALERRFEDELATSEALELRGGELASIRSALVWTADERNRVDAAIGYLAGLGEPFTADAVWRLCPRVPVTKGLTSRLLAAKRNGLIRNTGETTIAKRGGKHDHAQRLTVWVGSRFATDALDGIVRAELDGILEAAEARVDARAPECVERWPECESGGYDPRCCRFPKSCSCDSSEGVDAPPAGELFDNREEPDPELEGRHPKGGRR